MCAGPQIMVRSGKNTPRGPAEGEEVFIRSLILGAGKVLPTERFLVNTDDDKVVVSRAELARLRASAQK